MMVITILDVLLIAVVVVGQNRDLYGIPVISVDYFPSFNCTDRMACICTSRQLENIVLIYDTRIYIWFTDRLVVNRMHYRTFLSNRKSRNDDYLDPGGGMRFIKKNSRDNEQSTHHNDLDDEHAELCPPVSQMVNELTSKEEASLCSGGSFEERMRSHVSVTEHIPSSDCGHHDGCE